MYYKKHSQYVIVRNLSTVSCSILVFVTVFNLIVYDAATTGEVNARRALDASCAAVSRQRSRTSATQKGAAATTTTWVARRRDIQTSKVRGATGPTDRWQAGRRQRTASRTPRLTD